MRPDPRIRQTLDHLSSALESAADTAFTSCFTFTSSYLEPCVASLTACCIPARTPHPRRHRATQQSDYPFGFYDYYADEYSDSEDDGVGGFLGWGNGELDRLLAGSGSGGGPGHHHHHRETMHYGAIAGSSRKNTLDNETDPTVIPSTSMFGFLSRFGVRGRGMRYKPSAANLQDQPTQRGTSVLETAIVGRRRRANTGSSGGSAGDSLRSRGDLWPSEDEDDAVVINDDAFPRSDGDSSVQQQLDGEDDDGGRKRRRGRRHLERNRLHSSSGVSSAGSEEHKCSSPTPSSVPPTILSASPEPYMIERMGTSPLAASMVTSTATRAANIPARRREEEEGEEGEEEEDATPRPQPMRRIGTGMSTVSSNRVVSPPPMMRRTGTTGTGRSNPRSGRSSRVASPHPPYPPPPQSMQSPRSPEEEEVDNDDGRDG